MKSKLVLFLCIISTYVALPVNRQSTNHIERVNLSSNGLQANGISGGGSISADGRFVAFQSGATNLVISDTNGYDDVFLRDRELQMTMMLSVGPSGQQGDATSALVTISEDSRFSVFLSSAMNFVPGDVFRTRHVYLRDHESETTVRISNSYDGSIVHHSSSDSIISADGRFVTFTSSADNLIAAKTTHYRDIFVYDRVTDTLELISKGMNGTESNQSSSSLDISDDGRFVIFFSDATNLVTGDTNQVTDLFIYDRQTSITERVNVSSEEEQANGDTGLAKISHDGRFIVFGSAASNLVPNDTNGAIDIFLRDRLLGVTMRISKAWNGQEPNGQSLGPYISADGRFITYYSWATNLVPNDENGYEDVFLFDRMSGETRLISIAYDGSQANGRGSPGEMSADGRYITLSSHASNLVPGDTNGVSDVFVYDDGPRYYSYLPAFAMP